MIRKLKIFPPLRSKHVNLQVTLNEVLSKPKNLLDRSTI